MSDLNENNIPDILEPETPAGAASYPVGADVPVTPQAPAKNNRTLWIILVIVLILLCCCCLALIGGLAFWGQSGSYNMWSNDFDDMFFTLPHLVI
ncbi:MAG: hypothetical protein VB089_06660 [Anaerolineaceae bacterium]|nr:hypothetical protein [Anaerolineaceae bacterium]